MHALFADSITVTFQEALDYLRQKVNLPTKTWRDIEGRSHDRGFVVAGAMKEALLADFKSAVDKAIAEGQTAEMFRTAFEEIVAKHGWTGWTGEGSEAGRAWRARVIYQTNLNTAYAAGRYKQMTDPDVVKVFKYWRYRHAFYRTPERARPEHQMVWNGRVLLWNDPWWDMHYPPNGWECSCGVEQLMEADLKDEGISVDTAPLDTMRTVRDPKTGELVQVPQGIDFGWDHAPGRDWAKGLVPPQLQQPLPPSSTLPSDARHNPKIANLPPLASIARPSKAPLLPENTTEDAAIDAFLAEFGAKRGEPKVIRDASGHAIVISDSLFYQSSTGLLKVGKGKRLTGLLAVAEAIKDPDEIWVDWERFSLGPNAGNISLRRRYLRYDPERQTLAVFEWGRDGWAGVTGYPADNSKQKERDRLIEVQRHGSLLWRREK